MKPVHEDQQPVKKNSPDPMPKAPAPAEPVGASNPGVSKQGAWLDSLADDCVKVAMGFVPQSWQQQQNYQRQRGMMQYMQQRMRGGQQQQAGPTKAPTAPTEVNEPHEPVAPTAKTPSPQTFTSDGPEGASNPDYGAQLDAYTNAQTRHQEEQKKYEQQQQQYEQYQQQKAQYDQQKKQWDASPQGRRENQRTQARQASQQRLDQGRAARAAESQAHPELAKQPGEDYAQWNARRAQALDAETKSKRQSATVQGTTAPEYSAPQAATSATNYGGQMSGAAGDMEPAQSDASTTQPTAPKYIGWGADPAPKQPPSTSASPAPATPTPLAPIDQATKTDDNKGGGGGNTVVAAKGLAPNQGAGTKAPVA